jgi:hypothetical protein
MKRAGGEDKVGEEPSINNSILSAFHLKTTHISRPNRVPAFNNDLTVNSLPLLFLGHICNKNV